MDRVTARRILRWQEKTSEIQTCQLVFDTLTYKHRKGDLRRWVYICLVLLLSTPGVAADGNVTLESITIYSTHEWFRNKPEVYFRCEGEEKVYLPDVAEKDQLYGFIGLESWQPLTTLIGTKCKRCGLYEEDRMKHDDKFDQWELCPADFSLEPEGRSTRFKENEFNVTLLCPHCNSHEAEYVARVQDSLDGQDLADPPSSEEETHQGVTVVAFVFLLLCVAGLAFMAYSTWRRKQQEAQRARFVKLFEDDDDLDSELGLKDSL